MSRTEEAMRRAGPLVALGAASALVLVLFPTHAVERRYVLTLPLFVAFLLGCAAVPFSPAHRAAARRAAEASWEILAVPWRAATGLRWVGFTVMVFCAVYVVGDVPAPAKEELSVDKVNGLLPFLMLLAGVLAVNLSMLTAWGSEPAPHCRNRSAMPRTEEAMRRAGALAAVSALALVLFPAPAVVERGYAVLVLALFVALLLGCAAVLLSPAHRGVAQLARRAVETAVEIFAVAWRRAPDLRWVGFTGMLICAVYVIGDVRKLPPVAAKEKVSADMVSGLLPFLLFLAGALAVNLSMLTGTGTDPAPPPPPPPE
ncbi:unnamed protein product [Urochloa humidicola]